MCVRVCVCILICFNSTCGLIAVYICMYIYYTIPDQFSAGRLTAVPIKTLLIGGALTRLHNNSSGLSLDFSLSISYSRSLSALINSVARVLQPDCHINTTSLVNSGTRYECQIRPVIHGNNLLIISPSLSLSVSLTLAGGQLRIAAKLCWTRQCGECGLES